MSKKFWIAGLTGGLLVVASFGLVPQDAHALLGCGNTNAFGQIGSLLGSAGSSSSSCSTDPDPLAIEIRNQADERNAAFQTQIEEAREQIQQQGVQTIEDMQKNGIVVPQSMSPTVGGSPFAVIAPAGADLSSMPFFRMNGGENCPTTDPTCQTGDPSVNPLDAGGALICPATDPNCGSPILPNGAYSNFNTTGFAPIFQGLQQ